MLKVIERVWDIPKSLVFDQRLGTNRTPNMCISLISIFNAMIHYLLLLYSRFNYTFPQRKEISFLDVSDPDKFLVSIEAIEKKRDSYINDFFHHMKIGSFSTNFDYHGLPFFKNTHSLSKLYSFIVKGLRLVYEIVSNKNTSLIDELGDLLSSILTFIQDSFRINDNNSFLKSSIAETIVDNSNYIMLFAGVYSVHKKKINKYAEIEQSLSVYFSDFGINRFPQLFGLFLLSKLFVVSELENKSQMYTLAVKLSNVAPKYLFQPRDSFAMTLLGELTKLTLGKIKIVTFTSTINKKFDEVKPFLDEKYLNLLRDYLDNLLLVINDSTLAMSFSRDIIFSFVDPFSYLIPNLTKFAIKQGLGSLTYIPFNLAIDYVTK